MRDGPQHTQVSGTFEQGNIIWIDIRSREVAG